MKLQKNREEISRNIEEIKAMVQAIPNAKNDNKWKTLQKEYSALQLEEGGLSTLNQGGITLCNGYTNNSDELGNLLHASFEIQNK